MAEGELTLPEITETGAAPAAPGAGINALSFQPGMVAVTDANGEVSQVRKEDASAALAQGMRPATRAEFDSADMGTAGKVATGVVSFGRGVSFGATDPLIVEGARAFGGDKAADDYREALVRAKEANPTEDLGGEIAGSLAGMVLIPGGGAGAAAKGESLLARGASRFMAAAPRAALEGGALGLGHQISEDTLGNHEATAEKYLASTMGGMVFGGLLGGGLHAVGGAVADKARTFYGGRVKGIFARGGEDAAAALSGDAEKVAAHPSDVLHDPAAVTTAATEVSPVAGGPFRSPGVRGAADAAGEAYIGAAGGSNKSDLGEIWRNREIAFQDAGERVEGHSRDLQKAITEQQTAARATDMATFGDAKVNHMEKLVDKTRFADQADEVLRWMTKAQESVDLAASDTAVTKLSPTARKEFDGQMARMHKAAMGDDSVALFKAADDAKRFLGRHSGFGNPRGPSTEAEKMFNALYQDEGGLMHTLQSPVWGDAASAAQTKVNAAITQNIAYGSRFRSGFVTGHGAEGGIPTTQGNSEKVSSFLGRLTKAANENDAQAVREFIETRRGFLDATASSYDHGPAAVKAIAAERNALARMEKTFDAATHETSIINKARRLQAEEQAQKVGGALGLLTDTASKPVTTLQRLAAIEQHTKAVADKLSQIAGLQRAATQVDDQVTDGVRGFLSGTKTATAAPQPKVTQATVAAIREATRDPSALTARVAAMLGGKGLSDAAPNTAQYAATTALRIGAYLRDKAPKEPAPTGVSFIPERSRPGSATQQAQFAEAVEVANNPLSVVDDLRRGRVSREKVDALKNCYPQLYQQVRSEIASQAAELRPKLTQQQEVGLSVLFDVPVSAIMQPQNIRAFNTSFAQGADPTQSGEAGGQKPMQGGRGLDRKGSLASGFDKQEAP